MQTAKTIQLRDGSNNFISPATNIESLYYEISGTEENQNIIYRHSISLHFPVYLNFGQNTEVSRLLIDTSNDISILDISTKNARLVNNEGGDILISNFNQRRIIGTNYYALDISTYNLSEILQSYAGLSYTEKTILNLSTLIQSKYDITIDFINAAFDSLQNKITDVSKNTILINNDIKDLKKSISYDTLYTYQELKEFKNSGILVAGANYRMSYDPYNGVSKQLYYNHPFDIVLNALDSSTFDVNVVSCIINLDSSIYFKNNNLGQWIMKFDFDQNADADCILYVVNDKEIKFYEIQISTPILAQMTGYYGYSISYNKVYKYDEYNNYIIKLDKNIAKEILQKWNNYIPKSSEILELLAGSYIYVENMVAVKKDGKMERNMIRGSIYELNYDDVSYPTGKTIYLKDEFGNEAPYDFKNKKQKYSNITQYLFSQEDSSKNIIDYSLNALCHNNIIKSDSNNIMFKIDTLMPNVFNNYIGYESDNIYIDSSGNASIYNNVILNNNQCITLYNTSTSLNCNNNTIGHNNSSILITDSYNNTIGDKNNYIYIKLNANNNELGSGCNNITINKNSTFNIIECMNNNITIGELSSYNVIEQGCANIKINENINGVTFGPHSQLVDASKGSVFYTQQMIYARSFIEKINK